MSRINVGMKEEDNYVRGYSQYRCIDACKRFVCWRRGIQRGTVGIWGWLKNCGVVSRIY